MEVSEFPEQAYYVFKLLYLCTLSLYRKLIQEWHFTFFTTHNELAKCHKIHNQINCFDAFMYRILQIKNYWNLSDITAPEGQSFYDQL